MDGLRNRKTRHIGYATDIVNSAKTGAFYNALCGVSEQADASAYPIRGGRICGTCTEVYRNLHPNEPLPAGGKTIDQIRNSLAPIANYRVSFDEAYRRWADGPKS